MSQSYASERMRRITGRTKHSYTREEQAKVAHTWAADYEPTGGEPTTAQPGSEEKIQVLAARVERGEPLWVDGDATCTGRPMRPAELRLRLDRMNPLTLNKHEAA